MCVRMYNVCVRVLTHTFMYTYTVRMSYVHVSVYTRVYVYGACGHV